MTVWRAIEEILNDNPNIMINVSKCHYSQSATLITMTLFNPETFRPLYNIRQIVDYRELKSIFDKTEYENIITKHIQHMYLELKTKIEENKA